MAGVAAAGHHCRHGAWVQVARVGLVLARVLGMCEGEGCEGGFEGGCEGEGG